MRCLGIDYGEKRIGLAYGDELGLATPIPAAVEIRLDDRLTHIAREIERRKIVQIVVGYPYNMDGTIGFKAKEVDAFIELIEARFQLPITKVDERLTSQVAVDSLGWNSQEERKRRQSGELDSTAAMLILQDYLDTQFPIQLPDFDDEENY